MYITKDQMAEVFADTKKFYETDETLKAAIENSIAGTKFFAAEDYPAMPAKKFDTTKISVTKQRTFEAAAQIHKNNPISRIAVHNFASAKNPGGGVVYGSRAQEEALCRCSTLYPVLKTNENFKCYYKFHRDRKDGIYTDACIFTPEIIVCKSDVDIPQRLPQKDWFKVDVLTCAAPNLRAHSDNHGKISDAELLKIHEKRGRHMLTVLASCGVEIFVTGAFGCGAFRNNPHVVAQAFKNILPEFNGAFKEIVFAIYCTPRETTNFDAFKNVGFNNGN
jgi:uncharacterized protein (TIGR02452 family)